MIDNDKQRRWWFANHPEYSWNNQKAKNGHHKQEKEPTDKVSPEEVDAYVENALPYVDETVAAFLKIVKRNFGTEAYENESHEEEEEETETPEEVDYQKGWHDGYWAIRRNQAPPEWVIEDKSPYAWGVREGAATALDENEAWNQRWLDPLLMIAGTHPSRTLGKNLERDLQPRPSSDYDAHHLVPWRH